MAKKADESFESLAREVGADPDDPRIAAVLKTMAKTPPQPHDGDKAGKSGAKSDKKKESRHKDG